MTFSDTAELPERDANRTVRSAPKSTKLADLRKLLEQAELSDPDSAVAYFLNPEVRNSPESVTAATAYFVNKVVSCGVSSAALTNPFQLATAGTVGWAELPFVGFTHAGSGEGESAYTVTVFDQRGATESHVSELETFRRELDEIGALGSDWDGHDAAQISGNACRHALEFFEALPADLRQFEPYPEPDGSVGLEYHRDNTFSLYLSFSPEGELSYVAVFRDPKGGEEVHRGSGIKATDELPDALRVFLGAGK